MSVVRRLDREAGCRRAEQSRWKPKTYAKKFSGKYEHRLITGGIGHNLPQEDPESFAQAVIDITEA